jgi:hypothetical protein
MEPVTELEAPIEDRPEPSTHRRSSTNVVLAVGIVVGLVAATILAVLAFGAESDAEAARHRTDTLHHQIRGLAARATAAQERRDRLTDLRDTAASRVEELGNALNGSAAAQNAYVEITNRAANQYNAGDVGGATAAFQGDGKTAFDQMVATVAEADRALVAVQTAIRELEEEVR